MADRRSSPRSSSLLPSWPTPASRARPRRALVIGLGLALLAIHAECQETQQAAVEQFIGESSGYGAVFELLVNAARDWEKKNP